MIRLRQSVFAILLIIFGVGCGSEKQYFPVSDYLSGQIAKIDSTLIGIKKITRLYDGVYDTAYITKEECKQLAIKYFQPKELEKQRFVKNFTEEEQFDETLNRAIFRYLPKNKSAEVKKAEVLVLPGADDSNVTSIIIDWVATSSDSMQINKLLWQVDKSFQINAITQFKGKPEKFDNITIIWNEEIQ